MDVGEVIPFFLLRCLHEVDEYISIKTKFPIELCMGAFNVVELPRPSGQIVKPLPH